MKFQTLLIAVAAVVLIGCSENEGNPSSPATQKSVAQTMSASTSASEATDESASPERTAASSSSGSPARSSEPTRSTSPYLEAESALLADGGLSVEKAGTILQSDKGFEQTIRQFDQSAATSPEAQDLTAHYKAAIARSFGGEGSLRDFSCGLSLCVGSVRTKSPSDYAAWSERFAKDSGAPTYSFGEMTQKIGEGDYESRFVFSTDPNANSMTAKPKR